MTWNFDEHVDRQDSLSVKYDLRMEIFGADNIIPMWVADMDFRTPNFIISSLQKRVEHGIFGYSIRPDEYFTSITDWIGKRHGWKINKDWIVFSPGVVPALNFCTLAFTEPGDEIIVQPPVYFPFFSAIEAHERKLVYNPLKEAEGKLGMDFSSLLEVISPKTKMIMISNPHNPVGRVWTREELATLTDICLRYDILILSDEIHSDLILKESKHIPIASLSDDIRAKTITLMAPSKTFNLAGLSTSSVIISDPGLRKSFSSIVGDLHVGNGNIFGTIASIAAYSHGHEWLDALNDYIKGNVDLVIDFCRQRMPEIFPIIPEATYMIWLDCRKLGMTGKELNRFFIDKAGVGMNEGSAFGPGGEGFMRMNLGTQRATVNQALEQIEKAVKGLKNK